MNRDTKISIIKSQLVKRAAASRIHRKVMAKVAESKDKTLRPYLAGFCKAAEAAGVDPNELIKVAWTWGGVLDSIGTGVGSVLRVPVNAVAGAYSGIKNTITGEDGGEGFWGRLGRGASEGWTLANGFQRALPGEIFSTDTAKNLGTGIGTMLTGAGKGAIDVLKGVGGGIGALGYGLTGNGFAKGWDAGKRAVGNIGIGDYDLENASMKLDDWDDTLRSDYMERNDMDPNNLSGAEGMALLGLSMANASGNALGSVAPVAKGLSLASKGLGAINNGSKVVGALQKGVDFAHGMVNSNIGTGVPGFIVSGLEGYNVLNEASGNNNAFINGQRALADAGAQSAAPAPAPRAPTQQTNQAGQFGPPRGQGQVAKTVNTGYAVPNRRIYAADYDNM